MIPSLLYSLFLSSSSGTSCEHTAAIGWTGSIDALFDTRESDHVDAVFNAYSLSRSTAAETPHTYHIDSPAAVQNETELTISYSPSYTSPQQSHVTVLSAQHIPHYSTAGSSNPSYYPENPFTVLPRELGTDISDDRLIQIPGIGSQQDIQPRVHWNDDTFSAFGIHNQHLMLTPF